MRILVVEDDEGIANGLEAHLRQSGWAADLADGVAPAWAALCAEPFDLVLLDLGLRAAHRRNARSNSPSIACHPRSAAAAS